jgi:nitrogen fixation protein FixH
MAPDGSKDMTNMTIEVARRSMWRFLPLALMLWLVIVAAVNGVMIWRAVGSFPGLAVEDDFGSSNRYDRVLAVAEAQSALGWRVDAALEADRTVLHLAGPSGAPLDGAAITATLERPLGPKLATTPVFTETGPGRYIADAGPAGTGAWDLKLLVVRQGQTLAVTRRIIRP